LEAVAECLAGLMQVIFVEVIMRRYERWFLILFQLLLPLAILNACTDTPTTETVPLSPSDTPTSASTLVGTVEDISATTWTISGTSVNVNEDVLIKGNITLGDEVEVVVTLGENATLRAVQIELLSHGTPDTSDEVELQGLVLAISTNAWDIGNQTVLVTSETEITGTIEVGDLVRVHASYDQDGSLIASEIVLEESETPIEDETRNMIEFVGTVETISSEAWIVGGQTVAITPQTEIQGNVEVGDLIKVEAYSSEDGSLEAFEITRTNNGRSRGNNQNKVEFVGTVEVISQDSWTVDGRIVNISSETEIKGNIALGDIVKVEGHLEDDDSFIADEIKPSDD
jgi:hypothetical protein